MIDWIILKFIYYGIAFLSLLAFYKIIIFIYFVDTDDKIYYFFYYPVVNIIFSNNTKLRKIKKHQNDLSKMLVLCSLIYVSIISSALYPDTINSIITKIFDQLSTYSYS